MSKQKSSTLRSKKSQASSAAFELRNISSSGRSTNQSKNNSNLCGNKYNYDYDCDDDSSIEDDGLLTYVAFTSSSSSSNKKAKVSCGAENTNTKRSTSFAASSAPSPSSGASSILSPLSSSVNVSIATTNTAGGKMESKSELTEEEKEAKAKQIVKSAYIPDNLNALYWHMTTKRRSNVTPAKRRRKNKNSNSDNNKYNYNSFTIVPCRECHPDEIIGLNLKQNFDTSKKALVEYIDIGCEFKDKNLINRSSMLPYYGHDEGCSGSTCTKDLGKSETGNEKQNGKCESNVTQKWSPEIMKHYLAQARSKRRNRKRKSGSVHIDVEIRALELFLQRILEKHIEIKQSRKQKEKRDEEEEIEDNQVLQGGMYDEDRTGSTDQSKKSNLVEDEDLNNTKNSKKNTDLVSSFAAIPSGVGDDVNIASTTKPVKVASSTKAMPSEPTKEDLLSQIKIKSLVSVYWEVDDRFYNAKILSRKRRSKHVYNLEYDDGSIEKNLDFRSVKFRLLDGKSEHNVTATDANEPDSSSSSSGAITSMVVSQEMDDCEKNVGDGDAGDNNYNYHHKNGVNDAEDSDDSSYFSDFAEEYKHKSEPIRPRDVIEYYKPTAVFGDRRNLVEAEVLSVDPRGNPKLKLSSTHYLDDETKVRRIKIIMRGKLIDYDKGGYKAIRQYKLSKGDSGRNSASGILQEAKRMASIIKKNKERCIEDVRKSGLGDCSSMFLR